MQEAVVLRGLSAHTVLVFTTLRHQPHGEFCFAYPKSIFRKIVHLPVGCKLELHSSLSLSVCNNLEKFTSGSPFLCMDLSYITALLKDGFGFADSTVLQVRENHRTVRFFGS